MKAPAPGLYPDASGADYQNWDAASRTRLHAMAPPNTPADLRYLLDHPTPATPALVLGDALHASILQPDRFLREYVVAGMCTASTKKGHRCENPGKFLLLGEWFCGVHGDFGDDPRTVLTADQWDAVRGMSEAVFYHPEAKRLLAATGPVELSGVWWDERAGVACKVRADKVLTTKCVAADLKTTDDASSDAFERSIYKFGYHLQAGWYRHGLTELKACRGPVEDFAFICVESAPPHKVAVYRLDDEAVERGWEECRDLLDAYGNCVRTGTWPGLPETIQTISLPDFYWRKNL